ncbi:MAG: hypothetical protein ACFFG0_55195 [Candidatus Thorarchaeota archaeon]
MMKINEIIISNMNFGECKWCGDTGTIIIYRNDWEDFEEIECENCNNKH